MQDFTLDRAIKLTGSRNLPLYLKDIHINSKGQIIGRHANRNNVIIIFSPDGEVLFEFGTIEGHPISPGRYISQIAINHRDEIIVANEIDRRIEKYSPQGDIISVFENLGDTRTRLTGLVINSRDEIVVRDTGNNKLLTLSQDGNLLSSVPMIGVYLSRLAINSQDDIIGYKSGNDPKIYSFSNDGNLLWSMSGPVNSSGEIAINEYDEIFIIDRFFDGRLIVLVFSPNGQYINTFGNLTYATSITISKKGDIYIAGRDEIKVFKDNRPHYTESELPQQQLQNEIPVVINTPDGQFTQQIIDNTMTLKELSTILREYPKGTNIIISK